MSGLMFMMSIFMLLANSIMHLILMMILVILVAMFWLTKFGSISMLYSAMMGLVFLGGMSIIITYISCICPNYTLGPKGAIVFLSIPALLVFKFNLANNWLLLPYSAYFFFYKSLHWLIILCLFLLPMLILTNYLDISKGSFRSV